MGKVTKDDEVFLYCGKCSVETIVSIMGENERLAVLKAPKKYDTVFHTVRFPDEFMIEQYIDRFAKVTQKVKFIK